MRALLLASMGATCLACDPPEKVPLHTVGREAFRRQIEAEGILRSVTSTPVTVPYSPYGALRIAWIVDDGAFVREGDLLVRFDESNVDRELLEGELAVRTTDRKLEQREIQKEAGIANVERERRLAELELDMARRFGDKDPAIFSRHEIIESRIDENLAAEKLDHAKRKRDTETRLGESDRALLQIERDLALTKRERAREAMGALEVRAPHDGIVVRLRDWMGNTVQPGNTTYSGHPIAELPALGRMEAVVYVLEADGGGLKEEARAEVAVEGRQDRSFAATVRSVDRMPKPRLRGQPVQYFEATLELEETEPDVMKPGQRVRAKLILDELEAVLVVPRQAVFEEDGKSYVHRSRDGAFEKVEVALGPASLGRIVVESGLSEGDVIAARDPGRSRDELLATPEATPRAGSMP